MADVQVILSEGGEVPSLKMIKEVSPVAKATTNIVQLKPGEQEQPTQTVEDLLRILAEHRESVEKSVKLLEQLHQKGLLDIAIAGLEQGDHVLDVLVKQASRPVAVNGIQTVIALAQLSLALDPQKVSQLGKGVISGVEAAATNRGPQIDGMLDLLKALRDPDVARGLSAMLAILKGLGGSLSTSPGHSE